MEAALDSLLDIDLRSRLEGHAAGISLDDDEAAVASLRPALSHLVRDFAPAPDPDPVETIDSTPSDVAGDSDAETDVPESTTALGLSGGIAAAAIVMRPAPRLLGLAIPVPVMSHSSIHPEYT